MPVLDPTPWVPGMTTAHNLDRIGGRLHLPPVSDSSSETQRQARRWIASESMFASLLSALVVSELTLDSFVKNSEIEHSMYVLNVDLWSEDALKEVNLVRHTTASPSISSTSPASYAQIENTTPAFSHILPSNMTPGREVGYHQQTMYPPPNQAVGPYGMQPPYGGKFTMFLCQEYGATFAH